MNFTTAVKYDDKDKRTGKELRSKPLMKIRIKTTESCSLDTVDLEAKLKDLVAYNS